ncbi:hypothetical protein, partial [Corynebacterium propinquum]|uniref:hypothetical protein n=1 Tax=Corynebacterium propinquum TaxID=43769 RepID=UPI002541164C
QSAFKKAKSNPRDTPSQTHILTLNPKTLPRALSALNVYLRRLYGAGTAGNLAAAAAEFRTARKQQQLLQLLHALWFRQHP